MGRQAIQAKRVNNSERQINQKGPHDLPQAIDYGYNLVITAIFISKVECIEISIHRDFSLAVRIHIFVGIQVGYTSNSIKKFYHVKQEAMQLRDHKSLPLDAQCSKIRVGAAWFNVERVDVVVIVDRPMSLTPIISSINLSRSLCRLQIILDQRNNVSMVSTRPGMERHMSVC